MNYEHIANLVDRIENVGLDVVYGDANTLMVRNDLGDINRAIAEYQELYRNGEFFIDVQVLYSDDIITIYGPAFEKSKPMIPPKLINAD